MILNSKVFILLFAWINDSLSSKPTFTLDEFFNYTEFSSLTLAPDNSQLILIQTKHHIWDQNVNEEHLHFTDQLFPIMIGKESIHAFTWSTTSMSLFFATRSSWSEEAEQAYENEWKNAIEYREQDRRDTIYRVDIENMNISKIVPLTNISLRVNELICSPDGKQLVFSTESKSMNQERITDYGLYSLDLTKDFPLISSRITNNNASEQNLKWSIDGLVFFEVMNEGSIEGASVDSQGRLYSLNITDRRIERWATQFKGKMEEMVFLYLTN